MNWKSVCTHALALLAVQFASGFAQGLLMPPAIDPTQALWRLAISVVVSTLASAWVFATLSIRHPRIPAAHWAAVLGAYTAFSLALTLIASPWLIGEPALFGMIDWLAVAQGALIGTAVGALISRRRARRDSVNATPLQRADGQ